MTVSTLTKNRTARRLVPVHHQPERGRKNAIKKLAVVGAQLGA
jgi:hypothetical protein